jgi:hypothetical protein
MRSPRSLRLLALSAALAALTVGCKPAAPPPPPPAPECTADTDCAGALPVCQRHVCAAGVCTVAFRPVGTRLDAQTRGDCQVAVCGQNGEATTTRDDADVPDDGNECTTDTCAAGLPLHGNVAADTACGAGGALTCDGAGKCVTCTAASDCAAGSACQAPACVDGACSLTNLARGSKLAAQTAGDCKAVQCDGQGGTETVDDNADVPVDATVCTDDVCTNGAPSNRPATVRSACSEGNGLMCDGAGACVQCVMASDCPGFDTECNVRTCTAGVCGRRLTADNTPVAAQLPNDCKKVVCDGQGRVVTRADDSDTPNDQNLCTVDTCTNGAPVITNAMAGTACGTSLVCNGAGGCVGCNTVADCPGSDTECATRSCTNNVCDVSYRTSGTVLAAQTPGDCQERQCGANGAIVSVAKNTDLPAEDGNQCTSQSCSDGVPVYPTLGLNAPCTLNGNAAFCTAGGQCVQCTSVTQCAGADSECSARTCVANVCGRTFQPRGTPTTAGQTSGDCREVQCAGDGGLEVGLLLTDVPPSNGNQCQVPSCSAGGDAGYLPASVNSTCDQDGGAFCNGASACVQCNADEQCTGSSTECSQRLCAAGACTWRYVDAGIATTAQVTGDCREVQCAGDGGVRSVALDTDLPADDGNQCTAQACSSGTPTFPAVTAGASCSQDGGAVCSGTACVACITAADCAGGNACQVRTCTDGVCGFEGVTSGTLLATQPPGDCKEARCDGDGGIVQAALISDLPVDATVCTQDLCTGSTPSNPPVAAGLSCAESGGNTCNAAGACVVAPTVVSVTPADLASNVAADTTVAITFSKAMAPSSVTLQPTYGSCSGSVQVSYDNFARCLGTTAAVGWTAGDTVATITFAPGFSYGGTFKVRVTTSVTEASGAPLATEFVQANGFGTGVDTTPTSGMVISAVFPGGVSSGATYPQDFVELHNRGPAPVNVNGWTIQYASATTSATWTGRIVLPDASVPAGGFYLVQTSATSDAGFLWDHASSSISLAAAGGRVALVQGSTFLVGCPTTGLVDLFGWGTSICFEGAAPATNLTTVHQRRTNGCSDTNWHPIDFANIDGGAPRNSLTPPVTCEPATANERGIAAELDYCNLQFPTSLSGTRFTDAGVVYARAYEAGSTEAAGAAPNLIAQIGYGPTTANPQYQPGWVWTTATFNVQVGNDDEWAATVIAPDAGTYSLAARFSYDGVQWTYCDVDGAGANGGLGFDLGQLGTFTVTP